MVERRTIITPSRVPDMSVKFVSCGEQISGDDGNPFEAFDTLAGVSQGVAGTAEVLEVDTGRDAVSREKLGNDVGSGSCRKKIDFANAMYPLITVA